MKLCEKAIHHGLVVTEVSETGLTTFDGCASPKADTPVATTSAHCIGPSSIPMVRCRETSSGVGKRPRQITGRTPKTVAIFHSFRSVPNVPSPSPVRQQVASSASPERVVDM